MEVLWRKSGGCNIHLLHPPNFLHYTKYTRSCRAGPERLINLQNSAKYYNNIIMWAIIILQWKSWVIYLFALYCKIEWLYTAKTGWLLWPSIGHPGCSPRILSVSAHLCATCAQTFQTHVHKHWVSLKTNTHALTLSITEDKHMCTNIEHHWGLQPGWPLLGQNNHSVFAVYLQISFIITMPGS